MRTLNETACWIGVIGIIDLLHLSEQMLFGLGELAMLKHILAAYYSWFQQPDYETVALAMIASAMLFSLTFAAMAGGVGRLVAGGFVGVIAISELHHVWESLYARHYAPGTVTAIPYVAAGMMLFRAVFRERQKAAERTAVRLTKEAPTR
jgi:hypothetical protein